MNGRDVTKDKKRILKKGEKIRKIRFVIDGKDYGVAFDKIPSEVGDLYPCVQFFREGDSVEIIQ